MAGFELLVDGEKRWKAQSEDDVRQWLRDYRAEHAEDDPDAAHVQIRELSRWSWLTGGKLVGLEHFLVVVLLLVLAAPAHAALRPGTDSRAWLDSHVQKALYGQVVTVLAVHGGLVGARRYG